MTNLEKYERYVSLCSASGRIPISFTDYLISMAPIKKKGKTMKTHTPEQLAQAYQLGYSHGINGKAPLPNEIVQQLYKQAEIATVSNLEEMEGRN